MSALERVLQDNIARENHLWSDGVTVYNPVTHLLRALDAALEYWLMKHQAIDGHIFTDVEVLLSSLNSWERPWDQQKGWTCQCLD